MGRKERFGVLDRRQRLTEVLVRRVYAGLFRAHGRDCRKRGVDLVEGPHADTVRRRQVRRDDDQRQIVVPHVALSAEPIEGQEELVVCRTFLQRYNRTDTCQGLSKFAEQGCAQRVVQVCIGLSDRRLGAVQADAHALNRNTFGLLCRIKRKKVRLREQIAVIVVLRNLEQNVRSRYVDNVLNAEQQIEFFTNANVEVLHDLCRRQYAVVYCHEPERTLEESLTGDFAAKHKCKRVLPVHQRAGLHRICLSNEFAVDIDAASGDRIIIYDNVLQGSLEYFVSGRCR